MLMDHVFVHAPPTTVRWVGAKGKIPLVEHAPNAKHFEALCRVGLDQKLVSHGISFLPVVSRSGRQVNPTSIIKSASARH